MSDVRIISGAPLIIQPSLTVLLAVHGVLYHKNSLFHFSGFVFAVLKEAIFVLSTKILKGAAVSCGRLRLFYYSKEGEAIKIN